MRSRVFKMLHKIYHPVEGQYSLTSATFLMEVIHRIYQINLLHYSELTSNDIQMAAFTDILKNVFFIENFRTLHQQIMSIAILILQCLISGIFVVMVHKDKKEIISQEIQSITILLYSKLFYIPIIYNSGRLFTDFCYIPIALLNVAFLYAFYIAHIYFARCDNFKQVNHPHLIHNYNFLLEIIHFGIENVIIYTYAMHFVPNLRFALYIILLVVRIFQRLYNGIINIDYYLDILFLIVAIVVYFEFSYLVLGIVSALIMQLFIKLGHQFSYLQLFQNSNNLSQIILIESLTHSNNQIKFILCSHILCAHKCPVSRRIKCQNISQLISCKLKSLILNQISANKSLLFYYSTLADSSPLKTIVQLRKCTKFSSLYYQIACSNNVDYYQQLSWRRYTHTDLYYNGSDNKVEKLDRETLVISIDSFERIFNQYINIVQKKIKFYNQLIHGYNHFQNYYNQCLDTSAEILKCRQTVEQYYNLETLANKMTGQYTVVTLRLLQIYFTAIYPNNAKALHIQILIQDILIAEKYSQEDGLMNENLIANQICILTTSLVEDRGKLLNLMSKQLAEFLSIDQDHLNNLNHINQLMPSYFSIVHDKLYDVFIQRGYTKMSSEMRATFYQAQNQCIVPCKILLNYQHHDNNASLMNAIISRESNYDNYIVFGIDGLIYGMTEQFYKIISQDQQFTMQDVLERGTLIQFYIQNISSYIKDLKRQIENQQNSLLNNLIITFNLPVNHTECFKQTKFLLNGLLQQNNDEDFVLYRNRRFQSIKSIRSQYRTYTQKSNSRQKDTYTQDYLDHSDKIKNQQIYILNEDFQQTIYDFHEQYIEEAQLNLILECDLQYEEIEYKQGQFSQFILKITSVKQKLSLSDSSSFQQIIQRKSQDQSIAQESQVDVSKLGSNNERYSISIQKVEEQDHQIMSFYSDRRPIDCVSEEFGQYAQDEVNQNGIELTSPKAINMDLINEDERHVYQQGQMRSFGAQTKSRRDQQKSINTSNSSNNLSQNSTFLLLNSLYSKNFLIKPLKQNSIINTFLFVYMLLIMFFNVNYINATLSTQRLQILNVFQPQNMNYIMSSYYTQLYSAILYQDHITDTSPFLKYWNEVILQPVYAFTEPIINNLILTLEQQGAKFNLDHIKIDIVNNGIKTKQQITVSEFYTRQNQIYEMCQRNRQLINFTYYDFPEFKNDTYLRFSLVPMFYFQESLIQAFIDQNLYDQSQIQPLFAMILMIQIFAQMLAIILNSVIWIKIDNLKKITILLVAKLEENEASFAIANLLHIQNILNSLSSIVWKTTDFSDYTQSVDIHNKVSHKQKINQRQTSLLIHRINLTSISHYQSLAFSIFVMIFWVCFLVGGYLIFMKKNDAFQPTLTATLQYSKFRNSFDSAFTLGMLIKSEFFIDQPINNYINQTETILAFQYFTNQLLAIINEVLQVILGASNGGQTIFDTILSGNLCDLLPEVLIMCDLSKIPLQYYAKDDYTSYVKSGAFGYTAAFVQYTQSAFTYEFETLKYSPNNTCNTRDFQNFFFQYVLDVMECFRRFIPKFETNNQNITDNISLIIAEYYYIIGFMYIFIILQMYKYFCYWKYIPYLYNKSTILLVAIATCTRTTITYETKCKCLLICQINISGNKLNSTLIKKN